MSVHVKICGITAADGLTAAIQHGAAMIGLVFVPGSKRLITPEAAAPLAAMAKGKVEVVGLFVDAKDDAIAATLARVPLTMLQLHGFETPQRVADIRQRYKLPIIKALTVATADDLKHAPAFAPMSDYLLYDSKLPDTQRPVPGGSGQSFDWKILTGFASPRPWLLAGGLTPANVSEAIRVSGAKMVDVSSGVEDSPGHKDPQKIQAFIAAAQSAV